MLIDTPSFKISIITTLLQKFFDYLKVFFIMSQLERGIFIMPFLSQKLLPEITKMRISLSHLRKW